MYVHDLKSLSKLTNMLQDTIKSLAETTVVIVNLRVVFLKKNDGTYKMAEFHVVYC